MTYSYSYFYSCTHYKNASSSLIYLTLELLAGLFDPCFV